VKEPGLDNRYRDKKPPKAERKRVASSYN